MSCCAPPYFGLSPPDRFWVIALETLKFYIIHYWLCGTYKSRTIWPGIFKLHRNVAQHELLCTFIFWIISPWSFLSYCPWNMELGLESWNFTVMLPSMRCCTPSYFWLSPLDRFWVIALEILKFYIINYWFCGTHKLHRNVAQHELLCTFIFWMMSP